MKYIEHEKISGLLFLILLTASGVFFPAFSQEICVGEQIFTTKSCKGDDTSPIEIELFELVNGYRVANGLPALPLSTGLSLLGNRRSLDLTQNLKSLTHSWSNCPYDVSNTRSWPCVTDAPVRLNSGYKGQGYETLYITSRSTPSPTLALEAWKKSPTHNSIILNADGFKNVVWEEFGVAINGSYAVLWFGHQGTKPAGTSHNFIGLGVSYDEAVSGLSKMLAINQTSSTIENNSWTGFSEDKKIKLEINGLIKEISDASVAITIKLEPDQKLNAQSRKVVSTLLSNLFPEWSDIDNWIASSVNSINENRTFSRTKIIRKIAIELKAGGSDSLLLTVKPHKVPTAIEVF